MTLRGKRRDVLGWYSEAQAAWDRRDAAWSPPTTATRPARRGADMTPVTSLTFGPLLKRARRAARLTQAELAERAGFSVVYISMLERGIRQPLRSTLSVLTDALDLPIPERGVLESAAQTPVPIAARRRGDDAGRARLPVGGFLGALPADLLVGRQRELAVFADALAVVGNGQGRLLVLAGEP